MLGLEPWSLVPSLTWRCTLTDPRLCPHTHPDTESGSSAVAPECRLPCRSPGLALGPPRPSDARKSRLVRSPSCPCHSSLEEASSLTTCQAGEPSTLGTMTYQPEKGPLKSCKKNIGSRAPPRTHESESPGAGPGNLDTRAQSRRNTGSLNPFSFQDRKPGLRVGSALRGGPVNLGN